MRVLQGTVVDGWGRLLLATALLAAGHVATAAEPGKESPAGRSSADAISAAQINQWIDQLGDKDYFVRQHAQAALARLGFDAFDALNAATANDDLEIASRAKYLLRLMRGEWTSKNDPPDVKKCLRDYEMQSLEGRVARMHVLAALSDGRGIAALCRLVRFEQSPLLSRLAAVELLRSQMTEGPPTPAVVRTLRSILDGSKRPSAVWLLTWTRMADDPAVALTEWDRLVNAEQTALRHASSQSKPEIVAVLLRFQIAQLERIGKIDETMAAVGRLVELEHGDLDSLVEFGEWLVGQKAWKAVDRLAEHFATRLSSEPSLLYHLAQAYAEQGEKDRAEETANRALGLYSGNQLDELRRHLNAAERLRKRGCFPWARREFEHVIANGGSENPEILNVMVTLAEMLHDQGEDLDAAKTLEKLVKALGTLKKPGNATPARPRAPPVPERPRKGQTEKQKQERELELDLPGVVPKEFLSRMNFFFACHWEKKHDAAQHREYLDRALKSCNDDVDVLIACYRLSAQPPAYHAKIVDLIKKAAAHLQEQIEADPEEDSTYNQLAWLIGNTEGDLDQALKFSKRSLELRPATGGYYDTLARVYFARGELESAVKNQSRALELDPYSGLIRGQRDLFRTALEAKKGKKP
jgi:tetratricopeptide (TPR) repeat protein